MLQEWETVLILLWCSGRDKGPTGPCISETRATAEGPSLYSVGVRNKGAS